MQPVQPVQPVQPAVPSPAPATAQSVPTSAPSSSAQSRARRMVAPVITLAGAVVVGVVLHLRDPGESANYPTCPFLLITGWYCPGCGALRTVHALTHLDLTSALARNPLLVVALVGLTVGFARWSARQWTGRPRAGLAPAWIIYALAGVTVVYWVARNLPGMTLLSPA